MKFGYARVSTEDQHLDLQLHALSKEQCDKILKEKQSGTTRNRPVFERLLKRLKAGDILVVWKLDRLGRSLKDLIDISRELQNRHIDLHIISPHIDTTSATGKLFFHILCAFAEFESSLISERTKAGMQAAKLKGRVLGRPRRMTAEQVEIARFLSKEKLIPLSTLAKKFHCGKTTVWRSLQPGCIQGRKEGKDALRQDPAA